METQIDELKVALRDLTEQVILLRLRAERQNGWLLAAVAIITLLPQVAPYLARAMGWKP
jgi:hypothetical protein